ncbi:MAG TPA: extracellular solute-binding protein [Spirochaetales bacterium]|nr:extracellular solute-binding protein [Spirochaetales bacterium]
MKKWLFLAVLLIITGVIFAGGQKEPAEGPREVIITVRAKGSPTEHWKADAFDEAVKVVNAELKSEGDNRTVVVEKMFDDPDWSDFVRSYIMAADAGEAPDIILGGHEHIAIYATAGYIMPLADSVSEIKAMAPEFADVFDNLWSSCMLRGKVWGIPQDIEARPFYFNKAKLEELGWSDAEIAALPDKIKNGQYTLDDMIATAKEAISKGVVEPGYGYWHRPKRGPDFYQYYFSYGGQFYDAASDKLVVVKDALEKWYAFQRKIVDEGITPKNFIGTDWRIWHDAVSHGKALFWNGGSWQWGEWAGVYLKDLGGQDYLFENVGYALQPAGVRGQSGGTLSHPTVYMVTSEKASGNKDTDLAVRLLAKVSTKELNTKHAVESTHIGILKSQAAYGPYKDDKFLSDVIYMLDYNYFMPNHTLFSTWEDAIWEGMQAAELGERSPADSVAKTVKLLKAELGDDLLIK